MADNVKLYKMADGKLFGDVSFFLGKRYGSNDILSVRTVNSRDGQPIQVAELQGSFKLNRYDVNTIKYLFGVELREGDFLQCRASLWRRDAERAAKWRWAERDLYRFIVNPGSVQLTPFQRRDGSTSYSLEFTAVDYTLTRTQVNGQQAVPVPAQDNSGFMPANEPAPADWRPVEIDMASPDSPF